jgi:hypothetical protein
MPMVSCRLRVAARELIRDAKHVVASIELALAACERTRGKVIVEVIVGPDGPDLLWTSAFLGTCESGI